MKVGDDQMLRLHFFVGNTAGFDDDQSLLAVDTTGVAESGKNKPSANQIKIGFEYLLS